jgi:hypothetical protein
MNQRDFLTQVIDYVEASQEAIGVLQKEATVAKSQPAFSDVTLERTAAKLVESDLLSKEASENLIQSFREDPEQALLSLQKLAESFAKRASAPSTLGKPARIQKAAAKAPAKDDRPESDKAWDSSFGIEAKF